MPRCFVFNLWTKFARLSPTPFIKDTNKSENGLRFQGWIGLKSDAGYSYPAENSAPQGKREPLESTKIRDRTDADSRTIWRGYIIRFDSYFRVKTIY